MRYKAVILAYLPNKRILFLVIFVLLIFAGWFYFSNYKNKQARYVAEQEKTPLAVVLEQTSQLDADSDGDGLKDWEELLWKTDSSKPDTDGDGTNDNEEITLNRNPLKAGPDDKISDKEDLVAREKAASDSIQNTTTAAYARKFLTDYLLLKQQKGVLTAGDKNQLVESFMSDLEPLETEDKYKLSDLKITPDSSKEAVEKYADEIKTIFTKEKQLSINNNIIFEEIMKMAKEKTVNSEKYKVSIKALNYSINYYENILKKLKSIEEIPNNFKINHLNILNSFYNIKFAIENMAIAQTDPIKAMMGQKLYNEQMQRVYNALKDIQEIFNEYEITIFK